MTIARTRLVLALVWIAVWAALVDPGAALVLTDTRPASQRTAETAPSRRPDIRLLYAPGGIGQVGVVRENVRADQLTTREMSDHLSALMMSGPSVRAVHEMMAMLPHSLRYDVVDGRVICPYKQIISILPEWTTVAGLNQYDASGTRLVAPYPTRRFDLRDLSPSATPERFQHIWRASLPSVVKDVAFIQAWYEKRKHDLRSCLIYEIHQTVMSTAAADGKMSEKVTTEHKGFRAVVYHPKLDRCDPKKWYRPHLQRPLAPEK